ncbi:hypothetical protein FGO68_gene9008 [Halteria grandinella]|uniref:DNA-directed RNA polymerase RBP11-like dimerisation domain-containing protein n=1 Tax=Halteria grandinella TaxID=5974 RepID=A0A8J8SYT0_HALGN|nr:hypothetical protein FGO68_gene9008 [Halteria grandinella]
MSTKKQAAAAPVNDQDVDMESQGEQTNNQQDMRDFQMSRPQLQVQRQEGDNTSATYSFLNEDHTLGNLLRNVIIKNKQVEFCAYSVPHPSEPVMNLRLQVHESAGDTKRVLKHGLKRIGKMSDVLLEKFENAVQKFKESQMSD